jgi:soluble lytic murein transglycosylase-like protein
MVKRLMEYLLVGTLVIGFAWQLHDLGKGFVPVSIMQAKPSKTISYLQKLGAPSHHISELSTAIDSASRLTNLSSALLCSLMFTESEFKKSAVGPPCGNNGRRYRGLMQTPWASFAWADVDTLYGARILCEKLNESHGDLPLALAKYKGGDNPVAWRQARRVLYLYANLQRGEM